MTDPTTVTDASSDPITGPDGDGRPAPKRRRAAPNPVEPADSSQHGTGDEASEALAGPAPEEPGPAPDAVFERSAHAEVRGDRVEIRQGAAGRVEAGTVDVMQGAVGAVRADSLSVKAGFVGLAAARRADVSQAYVRTVLAQEARIEQGGAQSIVANRVTMRHGSGAFIVLARRVDGGGLAVLDWRGGLALGIGIGLVLAIVRPGRDRGRRRGRRARSGEAAPAA